MELSILIAPLFFFWGLGILFLLFRGGVSWIWKICAVLIFLFYFFWFQNDFFASWASYRDRFADSFLVFLSSLPDLTALFLFLFWPPALFITFFTASNSVAKGFLRTFILITLFYWLFWFFHNTVQHIPLEKLRPYLPERIEMPHVPQPPVR